MCSPNSWTNQRTPTGWLAGWLAGWETCTQLYSSLVCPRYSDYDQTGESDADWSGGYDDRRSADGYFFKLGFSGGAVSWLTKKQQTVELSSCEAEYQGLAAAVQKATFLRSLMCEMAINRRKQQ